MASAWLFRRECVVKYLDRRSSISFHLREKSGASCRDTWAAPKKYVSGDTEYSKLDMVHNLYVNHTPDVSAALNEVARMLEEPFMNDHNDVPLADLHFDYNEKLLLLDNAAAWIAL